MLPRCVSLLVNLINVATSGQIKHRQTDSNLVCLQASVLTPRIFFILKVGLWKNAQKCKRCMRRRMLQCLPVFSAREITNGLSTQSHTNLVLVSQNCLMEFKDQFSRSAMMRLSQKLLLSSARSRTIRAVPKTNLVKLRILAKVSTHYPNITFMEKVGTWMENGMQLNAFKESHLIENYNQMLIWEPVKRSDLVTS